MNYEKQIKRIVDYIKSGEKPEEDFTLGIEMEHFILDNDSLETVSYYGNNGVGETLKSMVDQGFEPYMEGDYVLGLEKGDITISTEPGSQFELAITSSNCIRTLEREYKGFFQRMLSVFAEKNQRVVTLGYHPNMKIDDIKILPKKRYDYMFDYFKTKGSMAHNMMKGTCSLQVTIDFSDQLDFKRKYQAANAMSPILYALFENAYIFEKQPLDYYNLRQRIWENTDVDRSGTFDFAMDKDMSYEKYAKKILETPVIFYERDGEEIYSKDLLFKEIFDPDNDSDDMIFHALSIVFPDIRVKKYLEFRMMDEIKYPLNFACVAFIKGLFYNKENLEKLVAKYENVTYDDIMEGKKQTETNGIHGVYLGKTILSHAKELVKMAKQGLQEWDIPYIEILEKKVEEGTSPRDDFKTIYNEKGLRAAVDSVTLTKEDLNV